MILDGNPIYKLKPILKLTGNEVSKNWVYGFCLDVETEAGKFSVSTDKMHHPVEYGMVAINYPEEIKKKALSKDWDKEINHDWAITYDRTLIAALALIMEKHKKTGKWPEEEESVPIPTPEEVDAVYKRMGIPRRPEVKEKILAYATYLDDQGIPVDL